MAAAAVAVGSPAGPASPDCSIFLLASDSIVTHTPCLPWLPAPAGAGGAARVQLATYQAVKAFMPLCGLSRTPADLAAARNVSLLTLRMADAAWSRLLTHLKSAGVFSQVRTTVPELHEAIEREVPRPTGGPDPAALVAADWNATAAFAVGPAGGGAAAVATRARLQNVRFLSLVTIESLVSPGDSFPFKHVCTAAGILGACLTQAARALETSAVQITAASIRAALPTATSDGALAGRMRDLLSSRRPPRELLAHGADSDELREEFEDGLEYSRSADGRRLVEEKRILLLGSRYATGLPPYSPPTSCSAPLRPSDPGLQREDGGPLPLRGPFEPSLPRRHALEVEHMLSAVGATFRTPSQLELPSVHLGRRARSRAWLEVASRESAARAFFCASGPGPRPSCGSRSHFLCTVAAGTTTSHAPRLQGLRPSLAQRCASWSHSPSGSFPVSSPFSRSLTTFGHPPPTGPAPRCTHLRSTFGHWSWAPFGPSPPSAFGHWSWAPFGPSLLLRLSTLLLRSKLAHLALAWPHTASRALGDGGILGFVPCPDPAPTSPRQVRHYLHLHPTDQPRRP